MPSNTAFHRFLTTFLGGTSSREQSSPQVFDPTHLGQEGERGTTTLGSCPPNLGGGPGMESVDMVSRGFELVELEAPGLEMGLFSSRPSSAASSASSASSAATPPGAALSVVAPRLPESRPCVSGVPYSWAYQPVQTPPTGPLQLVPSAAVAPFPQLPPPPFHQHQHPVILPSPAPLFHQQPQHPALLPSPAPHPAPAPAPAASAPAPDQSPFERGLEVGFGLANRHAVHVGMITEGGDQGASLVLFESSLVPREIGELVMGEVGVLDGQSSP